jgi:tetratricopeptide (TPR) repeat protein
VTEDLDAAVEAYEGILAEFPTDGIAGNNLAVIYGERGEQDQAAELYIRAIERGNAPAVSYTNAVFALHEIGQVDSAGTILRTFRDRHPDHPVAMQYSAAWASAQFDYARAEDHVRALEEAHGENPRWEMWAQGELASYAMIHGKLNEGVTRVLRAHDLQEEAGTRFLEQPRFFFEATGLATLQLHFFQDPEGAVRALDGLVTSSAFDSLPPGERHRLDLAFLYAQADRPDRAREHLAAHRRELPEGGDNGGDEMAKLRSAEGAIALADGNAQEAVRLFGEARAATTACKLCFLSDMGEAYEAASLPDSAAAAYREYLDANAMFRSQMDNLNLHRTLLGLGRTYEALGRPGDAADAYRRVLDLWADADPGLQGRRETLRSKLAELGVEAP